MPSVNPIAFIHDLAFADLPAATVDRAKDCVLDLIGVLASGSDTELSRIARRHAGLHMAAVEGGATILLDGRRASVPGAAYAGASTIDAFDAHDGHALTKGHAGVAVLPALFAFAEATRTGEGRELLTALVLGYEIATRAGIALHGSVDDYHTSGAWNALGCAAIGARLLRLSGAETRHALGIAEYHGPRSQMMRCIAHPTMLKDGSGWGAHAGASAVYLAADGFTGAPAITTEAPERAELWSDLGTRWRITEQYFKPHPVCRWAQPAMEAAAWMRNEHVFDAGAIEAVTVRTFGHAVALGTRPPATTEEAQYALGFPVACMLAHGRAGAAEITGNGLADETTLSILQRMAVEEEPALSARFPAERLASVELRLSDGRVLVSPVTAPRGDPDAFMSRREITAKFHELAQALPAATRADIVTAVAALDTGPDAGRRLLSTLARPPESGFEAAA